MRFETKITLLFAFLALATLSVAKVRGANQTNTSDDHQVSTDEYDYDYSDNIDSDNSANSSILNKTPGPDLTSESGTNSTKETPSEPNLTSRAPSTEEIEASFEPNTTIDVPHSGSHAVTHESGPTPATNPTEDSEGPSGQDNITETQSEEETEAPRKPESTPVAILNGGEEINASSGPGTIHDFPLLNLVKVGHEALSAAATYLFETFSVFTSFPHENEETKNSLTTPTEVPLGPDFTSVAHLTTETETSTELDSSSNESSTATSALKTTFTATLQSSTKVMPKEVTSTTSTPSVLSGTESKLETSKNRINTATSAANTHMVGLGALAVIITVLLF